jgi:uncharacterized protein (TIGR03083 family)
MGIRELYADGRERLCDLALTLGPEDAELPVPACPGWTVKDVFSHVSGVCGDVLAGRLDGVATDPWTAAQVSARAAAALPEVIAEWRSSAAAFDALLNDDAPRQLIVDLWTHEQDIRGALGVRGGRDSAQVVFAVVRIVGNSGSWDLGSPGSLDEPAATLRASDFELVRAFVGRRSRSQFLALGWEGDGSPFVDHLHAFPYPSADLVE